MYGIDFGTTYTVVAYQENEEIKFLDFRGKFLLPSVMAEITNLKRLILFECSKKDSIDLNLIKYLKQFFSLINHEITIQLNDQNEFKNCVITVPVKFNDLAKNFIKNIAIACNFHVIKLLSEPIAAAISTLNHHYINGYYIVYDLGGGTFDATLIKLQDEMFHVIKVDGLNNFGGIDIDDFLSEKFNISLKEANKLKKKQFLECINEILKPTFDIIEKIANGYDIIGIILNGGSCYLANIENYLQNNFKIFKGENLQLMVAKGACIYAYDFVQKNKFLIDVTPLNLGIEILNEEMDIIIPANSAFPIIKKAKFLPVNNKVAINIYQGPSNLIKDAVLLHSIQIETTSVFDVTFVLDYDGILYVKVLDEIFSLSNFFNI